VLELRLPLLVCPLLHSPHHRSVVAEQRIPCWLSHVRCGAREKAGRRAWVTITARRAAVDGRRCRRRACRVRRQTPQRT
jgi:hypothetical protein